MHFSLSPRHRTEAEELARYEHQATFLDVGTLYEIVPRYEYDRWDEIHNGYFEGALEYIPGHRTRTASGISFNIHVAREMFLRHILEVRDEKLESVRDEIRRTEDNNAAFSESGQTLEKLRELEADLVAIPTDRLLENIFVQSSSHRDLYSVWPSAVLGERNDRQRPRLEPDWKNNLAHPRPYY